MVPVNTGMLLQETISALNKKKPSNEKIDTTPFLKNAKDWKIYPGRNYVIWKQTECDLMKKVAQCPVTDDPKNENGINGLRDDEKIILNSLSKSGKMVIC